MITMKAIMTMKSKQFRSSIFILGMFICCLLPSTVWASIQVDGMYFDLNTSAKTASVASNPDYYSCQYCL